MSLCEIRIADGTQRVEHRRFAHCHIFELYLIRDSGLGIRDSGWMRDSG